MKIIMKKIFIPFLLLLPIVFSCTKELDNPSVEKEAEQQEGNIQELVQTIVFEARIVETKTQLGEKTGSAYPNYWSVGDVVSVNGIASEPIAEGSEFAGTASANFTVSGVLNPPYYCAYPESKVSSYNNGSATITLPAIQQMSATSYDESAFIMCGSSDSPTLSFSPLMSVIKLTVPGQYNSKIASVMFESLGSAKVSGAFTTDFSGITATGSASTRVNVCAYGSGVDFGGSMYILIPAQAYTGGMRFTIRATDGTQMAYSTSNSFTAVAGKVYPLTSKTYSPDAEVLPEGLMIMSSNVRFASARDKTNDPDTGDRDWTNRKSAYYAMVNNYRPAVIGLQEAEKEQVRDIKNNCSGYNHYGLGRERGNDILDDGSFGGLIGGTKSDEESSTILYRTDLITLNSSGTIWHSDTPSTPNSCFSEMTDNVPQLSTWAIMTYKPTNTQFFLMNVHLSLYDCRPKEIALILNTVNSKNTNNLPVIMTGDWNLKDGDSWLNPVEAVYYNARHRAQKTDDYGSYHWWGTQSKKIDHIYYRGIGDCYLFRTDNRKWNNMYISDHYPVFAIFDINSTVSSVPYADFDLPSNPTINRELTFIDRSSSPAGIAFWDWDFDGIRSTDQNPEIVFPAIKNNVPVRLTVIDNDGKTATTTKIIAVDYYVNGVSHEDYSSSDLF